MSAGHKVRIGVDRSKVAIRAHRAVCSCGWDMGFDSDGRVADRQAEAHRDASEATAPADTAADR